MPRRLTATALEGALRIRHPRRRNDPPTVLPDEARIARQTQDQARFEEPYHGRDPNYFTRLLEASASLVEGKALLPSATALLADYDGATTARDAAQKALYEANSAALAAAAALEGYRGADVARRAALTREKAAADDAAATADAAYEAAKTALELRAVAAARILDCLDEATIRVASYAHDRGSTRVDGTLSHAGVANGFSNSGAAAIMKRWMRRPIRTVRAES